MLLQQYGCGPIQFTDADHGLYDRHLLFDNVMPLEAAGPRLRVIANFAVGLDNIDLEACLRRRIMVTNTPDVLSSATAELALALTRTRDPAQIQAMFATY